MSDKIQKIRPALANMSIGDTLTFPIERMRSVRATASELGVIENRKYSTSSNREDRTITVKREE